jgi:hypothetical protein
MRRLMVVVWAAAMALFVSAGVAAAAPTEAKNYWAVDATCDGLGDVVIEVVNLGSWGAGKFQGTQLTGIPRWFGSTVTHEEFGVVFSDRHAKRPVDVDDVCRYWFVDGPYLIEVEIGVKVVGR